MSQWPMVPLSEVLRQVAESHPVRADQSYPNFGIYSFGRGLFPKPPISGATTSAKTLFRARKGWFIYSRLFAFEGAYGRVTEEFDGCFASNEYPMFDCDRDRILPEYVEAYFKTPGVWEAVSRHSTGMGDRRRRIQPDQFLLHAIPLPSVDEQHRLVAWIDELAEKIASAHGTMGKIQGETDQLLMASYARLAKGASRQRLGDIAPLVRRPASVDPYGEYPQVSVRSFGRGPFHNPPLKGSEITWEKPHLVKTGDVLISNIKAWEGAIAVARPEDDGRYGSHRYLTFVPVPGIVTSRFLCYHLLSSEGLHRVGEASPGSADRNRTTSSRALLEIPVPVPAYERQFWFGELYDKVESLRRLQTETSDQREMLMPSFLNKAFQGKL